MCDDGFCMGEIWDVNSTPLIFLIVNKVNCVKVLAAAVHFVLIRYSYTVFSKPIASEDRAKDIERNHPNTDQLTSSL